MSSQPAAADVRLVDDDVELQDALRSTLEGAGFCVAVASDGEAALDYLAVAPAPRLILLDLRMPRLDGWQFCEVRRSRSDLAAIPLAMMSAQAGPSRSHPYAGVAAMLCKPLDVDEVLSLVAQHVR